MAELSWDAILQALKNAVPTSPVISVGEYATRSAIDALKNKARAWAAEVVKLNKMQMPPFLEAEKQVLIARAHTIKNGIEKIFGVMPELQLNGLPAVVAVVGAGAVAASSAAIAKWYFDQKGLITKFNTYKTMVSDGVPPAVAQDSVYGSKQVTVTGNLLKLAPFVIVGGVIFIFRKQISKMIGG
jgi:hypothetical protein